MMQSTILQTTEPQEASPTPKGPGAELAAQREARAWTIEQVATQLNLAPRQIHALETDNFSALPGMACVRGFIRSYAKLLKIEVEPLLAKIAGEPPASLIESVQTRRALSTPFSDNARFRTMSGYNAPSKASLFLLLAVLLAVGVFADYQMGWVPAILRVTPTKVQGADSVPMQTVVAPEPSKVAVVEATNVSQGNATETETANAGTNAKVATEGALEALPAVKEVSDNANVANKNALIFKSKDDSWVEVKRTNATGPNSLLFSRVVKAGSSEEIEIAEPVDVTVGNAAGVEVLLRGTPVDLKSVAKNNIARLNLK